MAEPILRTWTIYDHPRDHPDEFVVREFHIYRGQDPVAGPIIGRAMTLESARLLLPIEAEANLGRQPEDDPTIAETWI